jgi:protein-L-isoaspartate(D-aspartate) O-methyltransferase
MAPAGPYKRAVLHRLALAEGSMSFDFQAARLTMVESQVRTSDVTDLHIQDAMRIAPRESLCSPDKAMIAYADAEIEYAPGRYLMRPREIGKLLQAIRPQPGERALAVGAPYGALVLGLIGLEVDAVEPGAEIKAGAVYDVILTEGSVAEVADAWTGALAEGGRLGVVVRQGPVGKARLYGRRDGRVAWLEMFDATPSFLAGFQPRPQFAF